jgi:hypothetical protein
VGAAVTTITDYASLVTAVTEYLAREEDTTLVARIPTFLQLTESKLNRELFVRQMENRATTATDTTTTEPQYISLPDDFQSMRRVKLTSTSPSRELRFMSNAQLDEYRTSINNTTAQPLYFTIFGTEMELCPTPDADYDLEMVYRANIPALTPTNTTNWLLTLAPDAYLYGALLESAPYIKEDARLQVWGAGFSAAVDGLNRLGQTSTFNAGPMSMRISGITP